MNRITAAFAKQKKMIDRRILGGTLTLAKIEEIRESLDMDIAEHARFQELKSSLMDTVLTVDEAVTLYAVLGEQVSTFNKQPCYIKAVATEVFKELLAVRIAQVA